MSQTASYDVACAICQALSTGRVGDTPLTYAWAMPNHAAFVNEADATKAGRCRLNR